MRLVTCLAVATGIALGAMPSQAFTIFHSPADDGSNPGVAVLPLNSSGITLNLWFDPQGTVFGYSGVFLTAETGITLVSFVEEADVLSNENGLPVLLGLDGGDVTGDNAPRRIGTLTVDTGNVVASLQVTAGTFTDASFNSVTIAPLPQPVAMTPEPGTSLLLSVGLLLLALRRHRA